MNRKLCVSFFNFTLFLILFMNNFAQDNSTTIVFCNDGHTNPYHVEWLAGFESAISAYNKKFGNINGYWKSATNLETQLAQVEEEIDKGVDILFVNAINVDAFIPLVERAHKKDIIWVAVHNYMEAADYNFILGDVENGYNQGLALATYFGGKAKVAIMLGMRGNTSGEARLDGILKALHKYPEIEIISMEPADWNTAKALNIANKWLKNYPKIDAFSVVTDSYLYPAIQIARDLKRKDIVYFGYDGDVEILEIMKNSGEVKADILLSATREGWSFVNLAYKISNNISVKKTYNFHTPLVLGNNTYKKCLENGFPQDIEVYSIKKALNLAKNGHIEYGPDTIKNH